MLPFILHSVMKKEKSHLVNWLVDVIISFSSYFKGFNNSGQFEKLCGKSVL